MEYKEKGSIPRHYRGPYNHNIEGLKEEREDYVPKEPVSQRFGELQTGARRDDDDGNYAGKGGVDATGAPDPEEIRRSGGNVNSGSEDNKAAAADEDNEDAAAGGEATTADEDSTDRSYRTVTKHSEINKYVDNPKNNVTKPERWDQMNLDDKKGWLDENT